MTVGPGCGCGGGGAGDPCDAQSDCDAGLVCDPVSSTCRMPMQSDAFVLDSGTFPGTDSTVGADSGTDSGPFDAGSGTDLDYITDSVTLPMTGGPAIGCDLNGDGMIDNRLGEVLEGLALLFGAGFDAQGAIDDAIADGSLLLLWRIDGAADLVDDPAVWLVSVLGEDADGDPLNNFGGMGQFNVAPGATPSMLSGAISSGIIDAGPGTVPLVFPVGPGIPPVSIDLQEACVIATTSTTTLTIGTVGGAVSQQQVDNEIVPAVVTLVNDLVAAEAVGGIVPCVSDNTTIGDGVSATCTPLAPGAVCSATNGVDSGICVDGGAGVIGFLFGQDADGDGVMTQVELMTVLDIILVPDVDLSGDGMLDAFSLGINFTAVSATIFGL